MKPKSATTKAKAAKKADFKVVIDDVKKYKNLKVLLDKKSIKANEVIKIPAGDFQITENDTVLIFCINSKIREVSKIFKSE